MARSHPAHLFIHLFHHPSTHFKNPAVCHCAGKEMSKRLKRPKPRGGLACQVLPDPLGAGASRAWRTGWGKVVVLVQVAKATKARRYPRGLSGSGGWSMLLEGAGKGYRGDQVGALISGNTEWKSGTTEWKSGTTHASSHSPYTQGWGRAPLTSRSGSSTAGPQGAQS